MGYYILHPIFKGRVIATDTQMPSSTELVEVQVKRLKKSNALRGVLKYKRFSTRAYKTKRYAQAL